jgi:hypothetical protein
MAANGSRVTQRELYEAITDVRKDLAAFGKEVRDGLGAHSKEIAAIAAQQAINTTEVKIHKDELDHLHVHVDQVRSSQKWWSGVTGMLSAIAGGIIGLMLDARR